MEMEINIFRLEKIYFFAISQYIEQDLEKAQKNFNYSIQKYEKNKSKNFLKNRFLKNDIKFESENLERKINYYNYFIPQIFKKISSLKFSEDKRKKEDFEISESRFLRQLYTKNKTIEEIILFFNDYYPEELNIELYQQLSLSSNFIKLYFRIEDMIKYGTS